MDFKTYCVVCVFSLRHHCLAFDYNNEIEIDGFVCPCSNKSPLAGCDYLKLRSVDLSERKKILGYKNGMLKEIFIFNAKIACDLVGECIVDSKLSILKDFDRQLINNSYLMTFKYLLKCDDSSEVISAKERYCLSYMVQQKYFDLDSFCFFAKFMYSANHSNMQILDQVLLCHLAVNYLSDYINTGPIILKDMPILPDNRKDQSAYVFNEFLKICGSTSSNKVLDLIIEDASDLKIGIAFTWLSKELRENHFKYYKENYGVVRYTIIERKQDIEDRIMAEIDVDFLNEK